MKYNKIMENMKQALDFEVNLNEFANCNYHTESNNPHNF